MPRPSLPSRLSTLPTRLKGNGQPSNKTLSRSSSPNRSKSGNTNMENIRGSPLLLTVQVIKGRDLAPKDKSGTSDPYLVLTLGDEKEATSTINKTLNPEWNQTFHMAIVGEQSAILCAVCWDKDRFGKDYMGEFDVALEDIFANGQINQQSKWYPLQSKRSGKKVGSVTGAVQLAFSISDPNQPSAAPLEVFQRFVKLVGASSANSDEDEDHLDRTESGDMDDDEDDVASEPDDSSIPAGAEKKKKRLRMRNLKSKVKQHGYEFSSTGEIAGVLFVEIQRITDLPPEKNVTRTSFDMDPFVVTSLGRKTYRTRVIRHNLNPVYDEKLVFQVLKHETNYSLTFTVVDRDKFSGNDYIGAANFPLESVVSLAPEADPQTGLYDLPEIPEPAVMQNSEAKKSRFRLPLSRSASSQSLSKSGPTLHKEMSSASLAQSLHQEESSRAPSSAPTSAPASCPLDVPAMNHSTEDDPALKDFVIPLDLKKKERWEAKHNPTLYIRAKYLPYKALRQQFWKAMLKQYDADDSGRIDKIELTTMLDTLGSTLHESTISGFFERFPQKSGEVPSISYGEAIICLEDQLQQTESSRHRWAHPGYFTTSSSTLDAGNTSDSATSALTESAMTTPLNARSQTSIIPTIAPPNYGKEGEEGGIGEQNDLADDRGEEHVIEIRECPICHQPRLNKKSDADIITHVATCASQDWRQVNNIVMAGFVTTSQAQRKWYSKVITKIGYGGYKLGANSANILVQDRLTGQINEERMSVYVRLGIRLMYKGLKANNMEKKRIKKLLRSLSIKQGKKFDDPASAAEIDSFINFHQLDMSTVLLPKEQFKNFNEFFYRELKPGARPCSAPDRPQVITSPADCRSVVFNRLDEAQAIWVKGRDFTVERLLGNAYPDDAKRYSGGALGIFRLAPQDYHRFHIPVDGVLCEPKLIEGEYYTVNPMAIRSALDVYGENIRTIVPIDSVAHGRVMVICVGAMMVGSTVITRHAGDKVARAEELGYFKFGGSTILVLFEPDVMQWDDDLVENSKGALETLIRVGMSVGHSTDAAAHTADMKKTNPSHEEKQDAKRRIEGSLAPSAGADAVPPSQI